jgi:hypothetical protein
VRYEDGKGLVALRVYQWSGSGAILSERVLDPSGALLFQRLFETDSLGRISRERRYSGGELETTRVLDYDARGNISRDEYDLPSGGLLLSLERLWDSDSRLVSELRRDGASGEARLVEYRRDASGAVREELVREGSEAKPRYFFAKVETDSRGNWTRRQEYSYPGPGSEDLALPTTLQTRIILYY